MNPSKHIFSKHPTRAKTIESVSFWCFRFATYFVIACASFIFLDIAVKGMGAVFTKDFPFVNVSFLTEPPQTLHVYEPREIVYEMSSLNTQILGLRAKKRALGLDDAENRALLAAEIEKVQAEYDLLDEKRIEQRFMYPDSRYRVLESMQDQLVARQILRNEIKQLESEPVENAAILKTNHEALSKVEHRLLELDAERIDLEIPVAIKNFKLTPELGETELIPPRKDYKHQTYSYSGGGIGPPIVGTLLLVTGSVIIALSLGVLCAVYLSEYSKPGVALQTIRLSVLNLSGVPSIVFGLFGYGMFVIFLDWNKSLLAGCFTLAFMALPLIIAASEESLKAIPKGFREGSLALGATKWTAIRTNVLPYAVPGILTSSIMGIARVAGETAPIMFTAAFAMRNELPWEGLPGDSWLERAHEFFFQGVMALPYHIYVVSAKIPQNEYTRNMQYGATFVFMLIVGALALTSILLRIRVREKLKW